MFPYSANFTPGEFLVSTAQSGRMHREAGHQIRYTVTAPLITKAYALKMYKQGYQEIGFLCDFGQMMPRLQLSQMSFI